MLAKLLLSAILSMPLPLTRQCCAVPQHTGAVGSSGGGGSSSGSFILLTTGQPITLISGQPIIVE